MRRSKNLRLANFLSSALMPLCEGLEVRQLLSASAIKDLNPTTGGSGPLELTAIGSTVFFTTAHIDTSGKATNGSGQDLWRTDGTAAGTTRIAYTWGSGNSNAQHGLTVANGKLIYGVRTGGPGALFALDPATNVSVQLTNFSYTGTFLSNPIVAGGTIFFEVQRGTNVSELWASDGTPGNTRLISPAGASFTIGSVANMANVGGTLYFTANDGTHGIELWKSDGTDAGTSMLLDINPGSGSTGISGITDVNGVAYFSASTVANGAELWKSDGTSAGTTIVADIDSGTGSSSPTSLANVNGTLYFAANDGTHGIELWKSDGTSGGTTMVADAVAGSSGSTPTNIVNFNGVAVYSATTSANGSELWSSDGTPGGTALLKDINPGTPGSSISQFRVVGSTLYFSATEPGDGAELWKTDGTAVGTTIVSDTALGAQGSSPTSIIAFNGGVMFVANDVTHGAELWASDGTAAGTSLVKDIDSVRVQASPSAAWQLGNKTIFAVRNGLLMGLWVSDGTSAGTQRIYSSYIDITGGLPPAAIVNGTLFFASPNGLWRTDGTAAGTQLLKTFTGITPSSSPSLSDLTEVNGRLFFGATSSAGDELWTSDGTPAGTYMVKDLAPGAPATNVPNSSTPRNIVSFNGLAYFTALGSLWSTDGTDAGTVQIAPLYSGNIAATVSSAVVSDGAIYLVAAANTPTVLWKSDGTTAGTTPVTMTGVNIGNGVQLTAFHHGIYFGGSTNGSFSAFRYDTLTGTTTQALTPNAGTFKIVRDRLFFTNSNELRVLNSDDVSSTLLHTFGYTVGNLVSAAGTLYCIGSESLTSQNIWMSDGTVAGTAPAIDATTAATFKQPFTLTDANDSVMFIASSPNGGSDVWWISNPPTMPAAPSGLAAQATSGTDVALSWIDNADNEDGFVLERSQSSSFATIDATFNLGANSNSFTDSGLISSTTYYYRLTAKTGGLSSSQLTTSVTLVPTPIAPTLLTALAISPTQINLGWNDNSSDETGFLLERSLYSSFVSIDRSFTLPANAGASDAYIDTTATRKTTYFYRVRAVGVGGMSSAALSVAVSTPDSIPLAPSELQAVVIGAPGNPNNVALGWVNNADNAQNFVVERQTVPGGSFSTIATLFASQPGYGDMSVTVGGTYTYRVRATNSAGSSAYSNYVTITVVPVASPVAEINPVGTSDPGPLTSFNGAVFFSANDGVHGPELWRSDGTAAGTAMVADLNPQGAGSFPSNLTVLNGSLYFSAYDATNGVSLWKTDGTAAGTAIVKQLTGIPDGKGPSGFVAGATVLYFATPTSNSTYQLWRSDGTAAGTAPLSGGMLIPNFSMPGLGMATVGDTVYFESADPANGQELWKADATGGSAVVDIYPGGGGSNPYNLRPVGSSLYFFASDSSGSGLFKLNTSTGSTSKIYGPFGATSMPGQLVATPGGTLYFEAVDQGREQLWTSDGTAGNTVPIHTLVSAYNPVFPAHITVAGESIYFEAFDNINPGGHGLYRLSGTTVTRLTSVFTGNQATYTSVNGELYFFNGGSLERSDGTGAGTQFISKLASLGVTPPTSMAAVGDTLFFTADPYFSNRELYKVATTAPSAAPSGLGVSAMPDGTAKLNWSDTTADEAGFWIERSLASDFSTIDAAIWVAANTTEAYDAHFTPGVTNYYRIRAYNAAGASANSGSTSYAAPPTPPNAPVVPPQAFGSVTIRTSSQSINLSWSDPGSEAGFTIERSLDGINFSTIATIGPGNGTIQHYEDTTVVPHVDYWYRVQAFNAAGVSPYTPAVDAVAYLQRPDNFANFISTDSTSGGTWINARGNYNYAVAGNAENANVSGHALLTWAGSTSDVRALQKANDATGDRIAAAWSSSTNFAINLPNTANAITQTIYAVDWDNAGRSERFDLVNPTTNAVLDSRTISNFQDGVYLSWNVRGPVKIVITRLAGPDAVVSGLFTDQLYAPNAPSNLVATPAPGSVDLAWTDNSSNEEGTRIERSYDNIHFSQIATVGPNVTSYSDTTAAAGVIYYYRVRAYNSWADSAAASGQGASAGSTDVQAAEIPSDGGSDPSNVARAAALAAQPPALASISAVAGSTLMQQVTLGGDFFVGSSVVTFTNTTTGQTFSTADNLAGSPVIVSRTLTSLTVRATFSGSASNWTATVSTSFGASNSVAFSVPAAAAITATATANSTKTAINLSALGVPASAVATYSWKTTSSPTGAPAVTFSANGTAAAAQSIATLGKAGAYTFQVTISDGIAAHTITRSVSITVSAVFKALVITPATVTLNRGGKQQFTVAANDQFGLAYSPKPTITWSIVSGGAGGTISSTGYYTAPSSVSGSTTIKASGGGLSTTAKVTISLPAFTGAKIDFAPSTATLASGYLRDAGFVYGARTSTLSYGWSVSHTASTVDRNKNSNQLLDTNVGVQTGKKWEIAVPNGKYSVKVGVGDSAATSTNTVRVEGSTLYSAVKQSANVFSNRTITVTVSDGRLTIDPGSATNLATRLTFLEITKV
jgi:ELWxxDGT repeat protein